MFNLVDCSLKPSRTLMVVYIGVHLLALLSVMRMDVGVFIQTVCSLLIVLIFISSYQRYISLNSESSIIALTWLPETKTLHLKLFSGTHLDACSIQQRLVLPFVVYILVEVDSRLELQPVIIFRDSCDKETFRRLRVLTSLSVIGDH